MDPFWPYLRQLVVGPRGRRACRGRDSAWWLLLRLSDRARLLCVQEDSLLLLRRMRWAEFDMDGQLFLNILRDQIFAATCWRRRSSCSRSSGVSWAPRTGRT